MIKEYPKNQNIILSPNFLSSEFDCKCSYQDCNITYIDTDLIDKLQSKRNDWARSIHITSGFRCVKHNKDQGGKPGSFHLIGKAADIVVQGINPPEVANKCEDFDGLGRYPNFTHVDVRSYKSRWVGKAK